LGLGGLYMDFAQPLHLYLLGLVPLALVLLLWGAAARRRALAKIGESTLVARLTNVRPWTRSAKTLLWLVALTVLILAIARPRWGSIVTKKSQEGIQVMLALDVSASMMAEDVKPNRLVRAQLAAQELMDHLGGNEVGLVVFAGAAFVQFPLTNDLHTALTFLNGAGPEAISRPGTALGEALTVAWDGFVEERSGERVIVLLSDGEGHEDDPLTVARTIAEQDGVVHCLGLGTPQGEPVPVRDAQGQIVDYKKDAQGNTVLSRLDESILQQIAAETGGIYARASASGREVETIANAISQLSTDTQEGQFEVHSVERFEWFAGFALLLLIGEMVISERHHHA